MSKRIEVVVIGGGYAGVMAANRLTRRGDVAVTLVNPRPMFVERIRLHQLVGGSDDAVVDFRNVLAEGVRLIVDTATRIDAAARIVRLATGAAVGYDHLIYAVGSRSGERATPGAAEFAYPVASWEEAERLRNALASAPATAPVTVVGAGPSGIENAAELAALGRPVTLVCGDVLGPYLHPRTRRALGERLARLGVTVLNDARVTAVTPDTVELDGGRSIPSRVTIWTAGFGVPDLAVRSGLSTDAVGRLRTDETLTSIDDPRIVAAGDSAAPSGLPLRMSCQAAEPLGVQAADTVLSRIAGKEPAPFGTGFVGECLSLGRRQGLVQFARRNDTAVSFSVGGRLGGMLKEFVSWGTVKGLALEARRPGLFRVPSWAVDPERRRLLQDGCHEATAADPQTVRWTHAHPADTGRSR
jgi:NADH:ubiquinone reductase (H+-translocating)